MSASPETGVRRALLIGIDEYQQENISKLQGCVNDVRLMKSVLEGNFGFDPSNITKIENEEATREGLLATLDGFVDQVGENDIVVIHYAGHGSQITDREGDEPSGYDSTIMPVDSPGWQGENKDISDDEIHLRLAKLAEKTPYITLIFDCCHSGTISRDDFGTMARTVPADTRKADKLPKSPIPEEMWPAMRDSGPSGWLPLSGKYVLMAGCRDEEVSYEYRPPEGGGELVHGALTYFLTGELKQAQPGSTYRDVFERAAAKVNANNRKQNPQMEGTTDREIFGVRDLVPMRFVRVSERKGQTVTLAAGAAVGMTVGSTYEIHPQGTKSTAAGEKLGVVEVTKVRAVTSDARIVEETTDGAIVPESRAFEIEHAYGAFTYDVQIAGAAGHEAELSSLRNLIDASPLLRAVEEGAPAAARVYLLEPRSDAAPTDPVPQVKRLDNPSWVTVDSSGELAMPPKSLDESGVVVENLETLARHAQVMGLENPDPDSKLRGKFSIDLLRKDPTGEWVEAQPDSASGQIVYHEDDEIAFRIRSHQDQGSPEPYVSLLSLGLSGAIQLVFPEQGAGEKLLAGRVFEPGIKEAEEGYPWTAGFPDNFPFNDDGGVVEGVDAVKLVVTTGPVNFENLTQSGVRGGAMPDEPGAADDPLTSLWSAAIKGGTRDLVRRPVKQEDWTTVTKSYVVRRKQSKPLDAAGEEVEIGGVGIASPGLAGEIEVHPWGSDRATMAEMSAPAFSQALGEAGVDVRQTVEVGGLRDAGPQSRGGAPPTIELSLREPEPGFGQMVMTTDELGVISWHFAQPATAATGTRGGEARGPRRTYSLPAAQRPAPAAVGKRGLVGVAGRKFLKELVFPLVDPLIGAVSNTFAGAWEKRNRPYRVRSFTPDDYKANEAQVISGDGWKPYTTGRALLMVHGTFSRAHTAFGSLPEDVVQALHAIYEGRVFAIDHYTLSHDPKKNVSWLFEQIPPETTLEIDIICHSRGGLVSRVLSEKQSEFSLGSRSLSVGKVVFAGTPNAGTILADGSHIGDLIDTFTNLANFFPDVGVSDVVAGVITVAKQLAVGAFDGLPGLQSMVPGGKFAADLNSGQRTGDTRYFALASNYTPNEPGLSAFAKDRLMDFVFKGSNDLVVPTDGVFAANGSDFFPIEEKQVFTDVAHTEYFGRRAATDQIMEWLKA